MTLTWEELGWERLAAGIGRCRLPGWDCTVGLVLGEDTALMVDAGSSLAEGARLRAQAQELAGGRVTHLALTHPHFDHVFGTPAFAGVQVYAAVGVDAVFAHEREELRLDAIRNGLPAAEADEAADALVPPGHQVSGEWTLDLDDGRQALLANVGPGHTANDLAVLIPGEREVVFCGDLVEESGEPQAGPDAVPSRWPDALDRLLSLGGEDALYVPGHGAVVNAAFVRRQRDALAARFGVS
ncbi:MBL fold metallo-hydrolase [Streptomyces broussonetiae]|uniref:MBL fold metallo-hydrolase n=2 Tax=Streptomyces broussonetiae TaxID=2686304 RepID=A0A6I6N6L9_9ACTN|nr:MBL fold metallo-hydrolase [Streptomyces broussonetiae]QHA04575.1 MBL fold metallo-hydrolase [Streptomyces broussonetiae]